MVREPVQEPLTSLYFNHQKQRWGICTYWPDTKERKRTLLGETVRDRAEAERKLREWRENVVPAMITDRSTQTCQLAQESKAGPRIADLARWYLDTHCPHVGLAEKTVKQYAHVLRDFQVFCSHRNIGRMQQLSTRIVEEWQAWAAKFRKEGAPAVSRDELRHLRHFIDECHEAGELPDPPKIQWRIPAEKKSKRFRVLTVEEEEKLLTAIAGRDIEPVTVWCLRAGWRIGDVLDFRWKDIVGGFIDRDQLKTKAGLCYPLTPRLRALLPAKRHDVFVFVRPDGQPWGYQEYKKRLEYFCSTRLGFTVRPRDLRKTFGTRKAMAGCPPSVLKELMGHEDVLMTMEYYVDVDLEKMAEWVERGIPEHAPTHGNPRAKRPKKGR